MARAAPVNRLRSLGYAVLLLPLSLAAPAADNRAELQSLHGALNMLNPQQQAIYQQVQMVQGLRLGGVPQPYGAPTSQSIGGQIMNYDEVVQAQKNAVLRGESLYRQADQLLAQYNAIEEKKKPLELRIYELSLKKK